MVKKSLFRLACPVVLALELTTGALSHSASDLLLSVGVLDTAFSSVSTAHAFIGADGDPTTPVTKFDAKSPATWMQEVGTYGGGREAYIPPSNKTGDIMFDGPNKFPHHSCMINTFTKALLQSGEVPWGTTSVDVHDKVYENGWFNTGNGFLDYVKAGNGYGVEVDMSWAGYDYASNPKKVLEEGIRRWRNGECVIFWVTSPTVAHVMNLDYVAEDGTVYVTDTSFPGLTADDYLGNRSDFPVLAGITSIRGKTASYDGISIVQSVDGTPRQVDGAVSPLGSTSEVSTAQMIPVGFSTRSAWLPDEDGIPNMPSYRDFAKQAQAAGEDASTDAYLALADTMKLVDRETVKQDFGDGQDAAVSIAKWKEERSLERQGRAVRLSRRTVALSGIVVLLASVIFSLIYVFDRVNPLGISVLSLISFGRIRSVGSVSYDDVASSSNPSGSDIRFITDKNIFIFVLIGGLLSAFLLSGVGYAFFGWFFHLIGEVYNALPSLFR